MREKLKERLWDRSRYKGTFSKYGVKSAYRGWPRVTLCLTDVKTVPSGETVTDHLWFNETKEFQSLGPLYPEDIIAFDARVRPYEKGYVNNRDEVDMRETDYKLSYPTHVAIVEHSKQCWECRERGVKYYEICPHCGYPNELDAEVCRRCSYRFVEQPQPTPTKTYTQITLKPSIL